MRGFSSLRTVITLALSVGLLVPQTASARGLHQAEIEKFAQQLIKAATTSGQSSLSEADFIAVADRSGLDPSEVLAGISYAVNSPKLDKSAQTTMRALYSKLALLQPQRRSRQGLANDIGVPPLPGFGFAGGTDYAR
ncbi:hypothetical protein [Rhizorhabdus argentea]|uniref:hypothetical protein n=1 Tax=Rhizorhabdus argentea TaxID=1387174 RepID=UPI0030EE1DF6